MNTCGNHHLAFLMLWKPPTTLPMTAPTNPINPMTNPEPIFLTRCLRYSDGGIRRIRPWKGENMTHDSRTHFVPVESKIRPRQNHK